VLLLTLLSSLSLLTAGNFAALSKTGISAVPAIAITGNIGKQALCHAKLLSRNFSNPFPLSFAIVITGVSPA